jgi:hypothetical protein
VLGLSSTELPDVELQLLSFENVTIAPSRLSGAGGDSSVQTPSRELGFKEGVELGFLLTFGDGALDVSGFLVGILSDGSESLLGLIDR